MTRATATTTLQGLRLRENHLFLALTVLVGIIAGLSAVLFALAIDRAGRGLFGLDPTPARLFLVPTGASLLAGVLLAKVFPDVRGSGVPQTKAAFHLQGGMIPLRVPLGKFLMGVLCVGSGHSMGREGPSVQIGAGLASVIGRWVGLPAHRVRELVPVGAAGALAAAFNTPVAAVIFALEELIGDLNAPLIGSTVVASVAAVMVERSILGNEPLFHVPTYQLVHPAELAAYAALGVVGGLLSLVFCRTLLAVRQRTMALSSTRRMLLPAVGGAALHSQWLPLSRRGLRRSNPRIAARQPTRPHAIRPIRASLLRTVRPDAGCAPSRCRTASRSQSNSGRSPSRFARGARGNRGTSWPSLGEGCTSIAHNMHEMYLL